MIHYPNSAAQLSSVTSDTYFTEHEGSVCTTGNTCDVLTTVTEWARVLFRLNPNKPSAG